MENFYLEETSKTPKLSFNSETGKFLMSGRSIPENSIEFYRPLFEWLDEYVKGPKPQTIFDIQLEYFNTSSSKCLVEIFRRLEKIGSDKVLINWFYEEDDEDMQESGEDFKEIIDIEIVLNSVKGE
jgi:SiaC family regulatory phosphoprotein